MTFNKLFIVEFIIRVTITFIITWTSFKFITNKALYFGLFYFIFSFFKKRLTMIFFSFFFTLTTESSIINDKHFYEAFSFGTFLSWKFVFTLLSYILIFIFMYLALLPCTDSESNFMFNKFLTFFFHIYAYFLSSLLSLIFKKIVLLLAKHLTYPIIWGNFIQNGLTKSSLLYPMIYLNDFFTIWFFFRF